MGVYLVKARCFFDHSRVYTEPDFSGMPALAAAPVRP
jgi:hypothetical protein